MADLSIPLSVLIPTRNEARNLPRCLEALKGWAGEIVVVDSQSTDETAQIAESFGARVVQFQYQGGWPKKRQWALDNLQWRHEWVLLLDADEILQEPLKQEIATAIARPDRDGYFTRLEIVFMGRQLRFGDTALWKLCLFRLGKGRFEKRLEAQEQSMGDIEVHEHILVNGPTGYLHHPIRHENLNSLDKYIQKHNEYSNWEAKVWLDGTASELQPSLAGTQAQRRRWLKLKLLMLPGSPVLFFLHNYILKLGFLDGRAGLAHAVFRGVQYFHIKAKIREMQLDREKR
jgi:glycosyltransferase involved in cell wall biosynthesis